MYPNYKVVLDLRKAKKSGLSLYTKKLKISGLFTAIINEALGHSSEATTKAYLDKFEQTEIDNTFKHLI